MNFDSAEWNQYQNWFPKFKALTRSELDEATERLLKGVPERSWINKGVELALLIETHRRTLKVDEELYARTICTAHSQQLFEEFRPVRQSCDIALSSLEKTDGRTIIFFSSKFGDYVSSQEYIRDILEVIKSKQEIVLCSLGKFSDFYTSNFRTLHFDNPLDALRCVAKLKDAAFVDLSGNHNALASALLPYTLVLDPFGSKEPIQTVSASLVNPGVEHFSRFHTRSVHTKSESMMFMPSQSNLRSYPEISSTRCSIASQRITFGAFCRTAKLNLSVIRFWAMVLREHPNSEIRFAYIQSSEYSRDFTRKLFSDLGVEANRVLFYPRMNANDYLKKLNEVDINLGAMPEQGGISCVDSLLMGCPYLVCNELSVTHTAEGVLKVVGLEEWACKTESQMYDKINQIIGEISLYREENFRRRVRERLITSQAGSCLHTAGIWSEFLQAEFD